MTVYGMYADVQFLRYFFAEHSFFGKSEYLSFARSKQGIGSTFDSKRYDFISKAVFLSESVQKCSSIVLGRGLSYPLQENYRLQRLIGAFGKSFVYTSLFLILSARRCICKLTFLLRAEYPKNSHTFLSILLTTSKSSGCTNFSILSS